VPPIAAGARHAHEPHGSLHADEHGHAHGAHAGPAGPAAMAHTHEAHEEHAFDHGHHAGPHDGNWTMSVPLVILGIFAIIGGIVAVAFAGGAFGGLIHASEGTAEAVGAAAEPVREGGIVGALVEPFHEWTTYLSIAAAIVGIAIAWSMWGPGKAESRITTDSEARGIAKLWQDRYHIDRVYDTVFGKWVLRQADSQNSFDAEVVDGAVNGIAAVNESASGRIRRWNTGNVQDYALTMLFGFIVIVLVVIYVPQMPSLWQSLQDRFHSFFGLVLPGGI
jgi:NADH:ubiquinone oxidoreductase subunit 5 (subunit L)/multisubunit Na+/H+ antiporter MnhA subunit